MNYDQLLESAYECVEVNCNDKPCDRFEIPKAKGHHLGSKTVVSNFLMIAAHLRRDPLHVMKFLSRELASSAELKNDRLILSRKLSSKEVNEKLEKYVEGCKDVIRCLACGEQIQVHKV
jgi:translation initiation factor 2 subunit 2